VLKEVKEQPRGSCDFKQNKENNNSMPSPTIPVEAKRAPRVKWKDYSLVPWMSPDLH
jgi:hypothetical protein